MKKMAKIVYESGMVILVMITIITLWTEDTYNSTVNWIVWGVFFADFLVRFLTAAGKWNFIKQNPFLLVAVIPFDQFFQMARIVRVIYLFRLKTITKYYIVPYAEKLTFHSKTLILTILGLLFSLEVLLIRELENTVTSYLDGIYVVFGYLLFFGHHMFVITDPVSIWTLTAISIIGIALHGLAVQWAFSWVEQIFHRFRRKNHAEKQERQSKKVNG
ncbi:transporter [Virgibacillus kekensis]|uniref:Transporter n=1 Tax=Virgibacillus kekensis TaxID=202261 RepID=A0ABV9DFN5_9BACI